MLHSEQHLISWDFSSQLLMTHDSLLFLEVQKKVSASNQSQVSLWIQGEGEGWCRIVSCLLLCTAVSSYLSNYSDKFYYVKFHSIQFASNGFTPTQTRFYRTWWLSAEYLNICHWKVFWGYMNIGNQSVMTHLWMLQSASDEYCDKLICLFV